MPLPAVVLTADQVAKACDCPVSRARLWYPALNETTAAWGIETPRQVAAWLAQVAHESGRLAFTTELWGPTPQQLKYEPPGALARGLGNSQPGDGKRYRGHAAIQVTGRANHAACRDGLRKKLQHLTVPDFEAEPEKLALLPWAAHAAGWFWSSRELNRYADGTRAGFETITRRINGGLNGLDDRLRLWVGARAALGTP